jgi:hypothetical protein
MQAVRKIVHPRDNVVTIRVPASFVGADIEVLAFPVRKKKQEHDFLSLAGRLEWSGDAVKEQRALRDEW